MNSAAVYLVLSGMISLATSPNAKSDLIDAWFVTCSSYRRSLLPPR